MKTLTLVLIALGLCFATALAETQVTATVEHSYVVSGDLAAPTPVLDYIIVFRESETLVLPECGKIEQAEKAGYPMNVFHPPSNHRRAHFEYSKRL